MLLGSSDANIVWLGENSSDEVAVEGDLIKGRGGRDTLMSLNGAPMRVDLAAGSAFDWGFPATISSIEIVVGTAGVDILRGDKHANTLRGGGGGDIISGRGGNDRLSGGPGRDKLRGGAGRDVLSGGSGRDNLGGGPGTDHNNGGSGRDWCTSPAAGRFATSCELR